LLRFLQNTTIVVFLLVSLASLAVSSSIWAVTQTMRAATLTKSLAAQAVQNRRQIAKLMVKARLKRVASAVPVLGAGAAVYFEEQDRREWLAAHPGKTNADYACEIAELTAEVAEEVLAGLPVEMSLPDMAIPECEPVDE